MKKRTSSWKRSFSWDLEDGVEVSQMKGFFSNNIERCLHSHFPCSPWIWTPLCSYWQLGSSSVKFASSCPFSFFFPVSCFACWFGGVLLFTGRFWPTCTVWYSPGGLAHGWRLGGYCTAWSRLNWRPWRTLVYLNQSGTKWVRCVWVCVGLVLSAALDYRSQGLYRREISIPYTEPRTAWASIMNQ